MNKKNNISEMHSCYGCGVCSKVCPQNIIDIRLNRNGFYTPYIIEIDKCTSCGLCLDVCAYNSNDVIKTNEFKVKSYAGWSRNPEVTHTCSSGGIGYELAKHLVENGYKACCARYNAKKGIVEHYIANTVIELQESKCSKYLQSFTIEGFRNLDRKSKYFITGTPCQIDSIRRYIRRLRIEDNFILMDFFCHGVPSNLMWRKYLKGIQRQIGKPSNVSWRSKKYGWHDSWVIMAENIEATGGNIPIQYESNLSKGDLFYKMFLLNNCLGKACYSHCKYKMASSASDIRIGDLWGTKYEKNNTGVNGILALTPKGDRILNEMTSIELVKEPYEVVTEGQMKKSPKKTYLYYIDLFLLRTPLSIKCIDMINRLVPQLLIPVFYIRALLKK